MTGDGRALIQVLSVVIAALLVLGGIAAVNAEEQGVRDGRTFRDCPECPEMVVVPAGSFLMGSSEAETERDLKAIVPFGNMPAYEANYAKECMAYERPQHEVGIRSFALGRDLVTRAEFSAFVKETGYSAEGGCTLWIDHKYPVRPQAGWQDPGFKQTDREPVVCVSWHDARAYIAWLNSKLQGRAIGDGPYRLPSEAEFEYAARAGTQTAWWWGDSIGSGNANCDGCGSRWDKMQTSPTGSFQRNSFGLSDVLGNAWEWTEDCWNETYADAPLDGAAWIAGDCDLRVMRGGSWSNYPWSLRSANRSRAAIGRHTNYIGFRAAREIP